MANTKLALDNNILRKVRGAAPTRTVSENEGRRGGYYGGEDVTTRSYHSVLVYVARGLADRADALLGVARTALAVQKGGCRRWNLYPMAFGDGPDLHHERKFFEFGFTSDWMNDGKIAEVLGRISGAETPTGPAVLPQLFPPHGQPRFPVLKSGPDRKDLMILVCGPEGFRISGTLRNRLQLSLRKHVLVARVHADSTCWEFGKIGEEDFKDGEQGPDKHETE